MVAEVGFGNSVKELLCLPVSSSCIVEMESGLSCERRMRWGNVELAVAREAAAVAAAASARSDLIDTMDRALSIHLTGE